MLVGRGSAAAIDLGHPAVSRRHAEVSWSNGKLVVRDLGSRTGTSVNGKRISEQELKEGDRIEFGPVAYEMRGGRLRRLLLADGLRLEASELAVERDGQRLLTGVNLTCAPNQFIGILGPSGSGKTTLIKCLAGYLPPAAGEASFDGVELYPNLDSYRLLVGYVPQEDVIYPALSSRENLDFALRLRIGDLQPAERADIIASTLDQLRLTEHADKPAGVLSGGQRKRLNVGMELLARPRILFLDEPTAGLDPAGESRLMCLLKEGSSGFAVGKIGPSSVIPEHVFPENQGFPWGTAPGLHSESRWLSSCAADCGNQRRFFTPSIFELSPSQVALVIQ
jgi:ABC-type Mn2+/Zn2+ transport system ATPase subunit